MNSNRRRPFSQSWLLTFATGSALLTGTSWLLPDSAYAQNHVDQHVAQSTLIRTTSAQEGTLYLNNDRVYSYNLNVSLGTTIGGLSIPAGATIQGRYEPAPGGLRYDARAVQIGDRTYALNANSAVIEDEKDPRDISAGSIAEDAAIGAAGGAVIGEIFGEVDAGEVIGGAAAGAATGNVTADRVVVVEPDEPIVLYAR